jgi:hypothetical protein
MRKGFVTMESFDQGSFFPNDQEPKITEEDLKNNFSKKKGDLVLTITGEEVMNSELEAREGEEGKTGLSSIQSKGQFQNLQKNFFNLKSKLKKVMKKKSDKLKKKKRSIEEMRKMQEKLKNIQDENEKLKDLKDKNSELEELVEKLEAQIKEMEKKKPILITVRDIDEEEIDSEASIKEGVQDLEEEKESQGSQTPEDLGKINDKFAFVFDRKTVTEENKEQENKVEEIIEVDKAKVESDLSKEEEIVIVESRNFDKEESASDDLKETKGEIVPQEDTNVQNQELESSENIKKKENLKQKNPEIKQMTSLEQKVKTEKTPKKENSEEEIVEESRSRIGRWDEEPVKSSKKINNKFIKRKKKKKKRKKRSIKKADSDPENIIESKLNDIEKASERQLDPSNEKEKQFIDSEYFNMIETNSKSKTMGVSMKMNVDPDFSQLKSAGLKPSEMEENMDYLGLDFEKKEFESNSFAKQEEEDMSMAESMPDFSVSSNMNFSYLQSERSMIVGDPKNQQVSTKKKKRKRRRKRKRKKSKMAQQDNTIEDFACRNSFVVKQFFDTK